VTTQSTTSYKNAEMTAEEGVIPSQQVLLALERILMSSPFAKSTRLSQFLRFAVEQALQGNARELKEYTIATEVYRRKDDFDPTLDTIVRSEARRLRKKLKQYYDSEGKGDPVVIAFRPGSYVPVHGTRSISVADPSEGACVVAVEPFESVAGDALAGDYAFGISDEILHHLASLSGIRVVRTSTRLPLADRYLHDSVVPSLRASLVIGGTVRIHDNLLRVIARATTADSRLLWSHRVDSALGTTELIKWQEGVAADVLAHIAPCL
jgi:TolB-like protein